MQPMIGSKVKERHATKWLAAVTPRLYPGEVVTAVSRTNMLRPQCDAVVVTNARLVAFFGSDVETTGFKREVLADAIGRVDIVKKTFGANTLAVTNRGGAELSFGDIPAADQEMVLGVARHLGLTGVAPQVRQAVEHQAVEHQAELDLRAQTAWGGVEVIGTTPSDKAWKALKDHCSLGEVPWFVIGSGTAGVLGAFADRL
ncbi:hypothetical protein [Actinomycetospora atypica]|uniref:YokE-like PH domain-containing protein n=1 Tax=Actinomycetospora atypica TaxID=1290095 RepID=A0ABV9YM55_9PSEU